MPVADFPGRRNWGYDGVLPFAPDASYGTPEDLKRLVDDAHARGLMVLLDVVYNHFGPEGNYLHAYAPQFFNRRHQTPWGAAINFDGDGSRAVRDFFIHNALYWLEEFHFDGLRLDAVHAIADDSRPALRRRAGATVRSALGARAARPPGARERSQRGALAARATRRRPRLATAQWNDDFHHALHVLVTGERDGYYADYAERPLHALRARARRRLRLPGRAVGVPRRRAARRAERDAAADRLRRLPAEPRPGRQPRVRRAARRASPNPRALRDGARRACCSRRRCRCCSWARSSRAATPFLFFCDFERRARRRGHARPARRVRALRAVRAIRRRASAIPDPNAEATFRASKLDWRERDTAAAAAWLAFYRDCLALRRERIVPLLAAHRRRRNVRSARASAACACGGRCAMAAARAARELRRRRCGATAPASALFAGDRVARRGERAAHGVMAVAGAARDRADATSPQAHGIGLRYHDIWGALHDVSDDDAARAARGDGRRRVDRCEGARSARRAPGAHAGGAGSRRWSCCARMRRRDASGCICRARVDDAALRMRIVDRNGRRAHRARCRPRTSSSNATIDGEPWRARDIELAVAARSRLSPAGVRRRGRGGRGDACRDRAGALLSPGRAARRRRAPGGSPCSSTACARSATGASATSPTWQRSSTRCGRARRRHRRRQSAARAVSAQSAARRARTARRAGCSRNTLYLDVEAIADFAECAAGARAASQSRRFASAWRALRDSALVDYAGVAAAKREVLELLFASFRERHLARAHARARARSARFAREAASRCAGTRCSRRCRSIASRRTRRRGAGRRGRQRFRDPDSRRGRAVRARARRARRLLRVPAMAGGPAARGGRASAPRARALRRPLHRSRGLDRSRRRRGLGAAGLYAVGASVGAPPDEFNREGQDWGLPPLVPSRLRDARLRAVHRDAAREHAPRRRAAHRPRDGADAPVLGAARQARRRTARTCTIRSTICVGLLALESQRHRCIVIGEDLGTVPDEVRATLARARRPVVSRAAVRARRRRRLQAAATPIRAAALATASTHDLPTLARLVGRARHRRARAARARSPTRPTRERSAERARRSARDWSTRSSAARRADRARAQRRRFADDHAGARRGDRGVSRARRRRAIVVLQLEDVLLVREQANLPGTIDAASELAAQAARRASTSCSTREPFASIARRLSQFALPASRRERASTAKRATRPIARASARAMRRARPRDPARDLSRAAARRLPLRRRDRAGSLSRGARHQPPVLLALPARAARAAATATTSSTTRCSIRRSARATDFDAMVDALARHGMSHLCDVVPNHMAIMGQRQRVVDGRARERPGVGLRRVLRHRLAAAGSRPRRQGAGAGARRSLRRRARARRARARASSAKRRVRRPLPRASVADRSARMRADRRSSRVAGVAERAAARGGRRKPSALVDALRLLPPRDATTRRATSSARRDEAALQARARAARRRASAARGRDRRRRAALQRHARRAGRRSSALHALLEAQAFRLAYWRVASDEINYRRFFDVNDLAALRMEDERGLRSDASLPARACRRRQDRRAAHRSSRRAATIRPLLRAPADALSRARRVADGRERGRRARRSTSRIEKISAPHERLPERLGRCTATPGIRFANDDQRRARRSDRAPTRRARLARLRRRRGARLRDGGVRGQARHHARLARGRAERARRPRAAGSRAPTAARATSRSARCARRSPRSSRGFPSTGPTSSARGASAQDRRYIEWAVSRARRASRARRSDDLRLRPRAAARRRRPTTRRDRRQQRYLEFAMRFQQFTAPVTAKGVEDTSFYTHTRLVSLNDVGGDPGSSA